MSISKKSNHVIWKIITVCQKRPNREKESKGSNPKSTRKSGKSKIFWYCHARTHYSEYLMVSL